MRIAESKLDVLALHLGAIADAHDLELALEAFLDAVDHVRDERAHEAVQRTHGTVVGAARDGHHVVRETHGEAARHGLTELALRSLRANGLALHGHLDPLRDGDGLLTDS